MDDRLITVAIHTYERALELKALLESEGVTATLQNVNLTNPVVASGVRVRIREKDLPLALRIIENAEIFITHKITATHTTGGVILIPVDFTPHSEHALRLAFKIAANHKADIVLLHSFVDPSVTGALQLSDTLDYDLPTGEMREQLMADAEARMKELAAKIRDEIKSGNIPPVKFTHEVVEGVPEEAINDWAKTNNPLLIVMGTRRADTKERELVGSVTAEVLDTCRFPIFTLPEASEIVEFDRLHRVAIFSRLDQEDILAIDALTRLLSPENLSATFVTIPAKKSRPSDTESGVKALLRYCSEHYPEYDFNAHNLSREHAAKEFNQLIVREKISMMVVPNRKKNIFARLFNPGIAHRLLFDTDIPMLVIPV